MDVPLEMISIAWSLAMFLSVNRDLKRSASWTFPDLLQRESSRYWKLTVERSSICCLLYSKRKRERKETKNFEFWLFLFVFIAGKPPLAFRSDNQFHLGNHHTPQKSQAGSGSPTGMSYNQLQVACFCCISIYNITKTWMDSKLRDPL